jgi:sporulation protein YlmC with PRC-barrel domain
MAGAGVTVFTAGSQLLASDVNTYLMDQVVAYFADVTARTNAFIGAGAPTLSPGRVCYLFSDNKLYVYNNTNEWQEIGAQLDDSEVTTAKINNLAVTEAKLADNSVTSAKILDGTIVNADINASAGIALSKLAAGTIGTVVLHNASGVPTATALSGDVTISSSGVTAISSDAIVNADVNSSAAIAYSKLNLATSITNSDIATNAGIALTKVADVTISQKTTTPYVIALGDKNSLIEMNLAGANVVNVPTNASTAFPIGTVINIVQYGAGKTQVVASTPGTTSVRATPGNFLRDRYATAALIKRGTDEWYLIGDLSES